MSANLTKVLGIAQEMGLEIEYQPGPTRDVPVLFCTVEESEELAQRVRFALDHTDAADRVYFFCIYQRGPCDIVGFLLLTMDDLHAIDLYTYNPYTDVYHLAEGTITKQVIVDIMGPEWQADWQAFQQWKSHVQDPEMPADTL